MVEFDSFAVCFRHSGLDYAAHTEYSEKVCPFNLVFRDSDAVCRKGLHSVVCVV